MKFLQIAGFLFMIGCELGVDDSRTERSPPFFAAYPFEYIVATPETVALTDPSAEEGQTTSCGVWLEKLNKAELKVQDVISDPSDVDERVAVSMASYSYMLGLFYDCNQREQATDDGVKLITDNDDIVKYEAAIIGEGDERLDFTRFVTWNEHKNGEGEVPSSAGEADKIDGFMANLYLQEDKTRTQTRIELTKREALRHITTLFWSNLPQQKEMALRGEVVEYDDGEVKEQLLSLRYYGGHVSSRVWMMLAHMKADGSAILLASCDINSATEDFNKSCATSEFTLYRLDSKGKPCTETTCTDANFKITLDDFLTNRDAKWAHGDYDKDKLDPRLPFFAGEGDLAANRVATFTEDVPATPTPALQ